ncbi:hypothetical protein ABLB84_10840 [Xenorhabdus szentirmaii]|uniref:hypothetical protein n=1 Tax=Xenorhabdus szentirmaii TaxID=290112 RepID=UPI0032B784F6
MNKYLEDALAFFKPAPDSWVNQVSAEATGEWIWEVLKGDFHDDPSTAQVVTGTVISVIPYVDQICDIRDLIANCKKSVKTRMMSAIRPVQAGTRPT